MKELRGKNLLLVGFTLFSMFFGAGNLIIPPALGAQAGAAAWVAFAGFALSAVGLPILGVVAVARSGGLGALAGRVHPMFAAAFTMLIYLSIGPCLAIPRTASTSFEMAIPPFLGPDAPIQLLQLLYSVVFFAVALLVAMRPEKLSDRTGKLLSPILLTLIVVIFVACVVHPIGSYGEVTGVYTRNTAVQGFLGGYQTMDTIAALNFGIVIAMNIKARGVQDEGGMVRGTIRAGWIAGALLLVVYAMLTHIGGVASGAFPGSANGAEVLTQMVSAQFGRLGNAILAAIFVIACFNTCVGLISCCSEYFSLIFPKVSYRAWAVFFAVTSMAVSNVGLNQLLGISAPVLSAIYPVAIVLIALSFLSRWLEGRPWVWRLSILFTGVVGVVYAVAGAKLLPSHVVDALTMVPLGGTGLEWLLPAVLGGLLGLLFPKEPAAGEKK